MNDRVVIDTVAVQGNLGSIFTSLLHFQMDYPLVSGKPFDFDMEGRDLLPKNNNLKNLHFVLGKMVIIYLQNLIKFHHMYKYEITLPHTRNMLSVTVVLVSHPIKH